MTRCLRCNGLIIKDLDRESLTGLKCVNCGFNGVMPKSVEIKDLEPEDGCTRLDNSGYCGDERAPGSKYCLYHRDRMLRYNATAKTKKTKVVGPVFPFMPTMFHGDKP